MSDEPWDQGDEHRRADFEHMLARMEQDWQDRGVEAAEDSLARSATATSTPMPDTAHPALERYADAVRGFRIDGPVRLPVVRPLAATFDKPEDAYPTSIALPTLTLDRRKCGGPAPFIGDPRWEQAAYFWPVWVDEYGRHIAGSVELVWRP